jgi:hypothetical protein
MAYKPVQSGHVTKTMIAFDCIAHKLPQTLALLHKKLH